MYARSSVFWSKLNIAVYETYRIITEKQRRFIKIVQIPAKPKCHPHSIREAAAAEVRSKSRDEFFMLEQ